MISVTSIINFSAAHRIVGYSGNCRFLHGHSYVLEVSFASGHLDDLGMVIDFAVIKQKLGKWVKDNWDHNTILFNKDRELGLAIEAETGQKIFFMNENPTCENMALFLFHKICPTIFEGLGAKCSGIKLYESSTSYAEITA